MTTTDAPVTDGATTGPAHGSPGEEGSIVTEYGLVAVIGATIAGVVIRWATGGAVTELLGAVLVRVRGLIGA